MKNMLQQLANNSQKAIADGVYEITEKLQRSKNNLVDDIRKNKHASLITEVKFSSPSLGSIRQISDPIEIAKYEIEQRVAPLIIQRHIPDISKPEGYRIEEWTLKELDICDY